MRLKMLYRLTQVEALKFWRKSIAWAVLVLITLAPAVVEAVIYRLSRHNAYFPNAARFLFSAEILMFIALATVVLSVMALGNDYELGTLRVFISRGIARSQFILSKSLATLGAALVYGFAYLAAGALSIYCAHALSGPAPFFQAAGGAILWRMLGAVGVIGLFNFALSGVVLLALVLGRSSWFGMLAGLGYFFVDFFFIALGSGFVLGIEVYRYSLSYYTISLLEKLFPSAPGFSLPRAWAAAGFASPGSAVFFLLLYGAALILASILVFRRQDLMAKAG